MYVVIISCAGRPSVTLNIGNNKIIYSLRVKKFCATTRFNASKVLATGFQAPYTLGEGLARTLEFEFVHPREDDVIFKSE